MGVKKDLYSFIGLVQRFENLVFGYRKRGKDVDKRAKRTVSKR
jgi:hypothetical protein